MKVSSPAVQQSMPLCGWDGPNCWGDGCYWQGAEDVPISDMIPRIDLNCMTPTDDEYWRSGRGDRSGSVF